MVPTPSRVPTDESSACPSEDVLAGFLAGDASAGDRVAIEGHVDTCARCAETLGLYAGAFTEASDARASEPEPEPERETPSLRRFADRYTIRECVGFGSGGTVYRAYDPELDRIVALKVLNAGPGGTLQPVHRWTREAKVMAKVVHPNVVTVHDVGFAHDNVFLATEFVDGSNLDRWLEAEPRGWQEVLQVFVDAGRGLAAIHECGLVHRDFKPHNVMLGSDGRVRVTDFGLARQMPELGETEEVTVDESLLSPEMLAETVMSRTRTGTVVGTPRYMSPEQWRGRRADARSDQFSFCVALYEALWRRRPYQGDTAVELAAAVCDGYAAMPPTACKVPRWIGQVVMRGLSRDPEDRFADMPKLLHALTETPRRARRRLTTALLGLGFIGVAGGGYALASLPADTCQADVERLEGAWDASTREAVLGALASVPAEVSAEVASTLDDWTSQWRAVSTEACEHARAHEGASDRQHELRAACLDRRLSELRAVTGVLRDADPTTAGRAADIVATLTSPSRCEDVETLATLEPVYASPMAKRLAQELAEDIGRVEALRVGGRHDEALALARSLVQRAEAEGDHAVRAETLNSLGIVLSARKEPVAAERTLRDAVWSAEASGHVEIAGTAWIELVNVVGVQREHYEEGVAAADRAAAAVHRLQDPEMAMQLASNRAVLESLNGHYDRALEQHLEVLRQAEALYGEDDARQVARVHMNLAAVLSHLGRLDEAMQHARRGLAIQDARFSEPHPVTTEMLNTIGALEVHLGDDEAARAAIERGIEIAEATLPKDSLTRASLVANRAQLDMRQKRPFDARSGFEEALRIHRQVHGRSHPDIAIALHNLAAVHDELGDRDAAIATYREALQIRRETLGPDHPGTATTMHNLGLVLSNGSEIDEGIELLEGALAIRVRVKMDPYYRATSSFMLARALLKRGETDRAVQMAEQSREHMQGIAPRHPEILEAVETWLAKHGT